jgi:hypothetical protein
MKPEIMKFRHASPLAIVGWYLMVPPMAADLNSTCSSSGWPAFSEMAFSLLTWNRSRKQDRERELRVLRGH